MGPGATQNASSDHVFHNPMIAGQRSTKKWCRSALIPRLSKIISSISRGKERVGHPASPSYPYQQLQQRWRRVFSIVERMTVDGRHWMTDKMSDVRVFINRKPGLRLEPAGVSSVSGSSFGGARGCRVAARNFAPFLLLGHHRASARRCCSLREGTMGS